MHLANFEVPCEMNDSSILLDEEFDAFDSRTINDESLHAADEDWADEAEIMNMGI